ncbi:TPA: opacity family porin, partial [Neisseria gonorrhoeae]
YSVNIERVKENNSNGKKLTQDLKTENQENGTFHAVSSLGLSAIYDFQINDKFKPYIGARVAYGHVKHQVRSVESETTIVLTTVPGIKVPGRNIQGPIPQPAYHE